jgi:hypothetical protein
MLVLGSSALAFGDALVYAPDRASVSINPGGSASIPTNLTLTATTDKTYYVFTLDRVFGNMPIGWVSPDRGYAFLSRWTQTAPVTYTISVPAGTEPGTYYGYIHPEMMGSHGYGFLIGGFFVEVEVPSAYLLCSGIPAVEISSVSPSELFPPDKRIRPVRIHGFVSAPDGCNLFDYAYAVTDEYGEFDSSGPLAVSADGSFDLTLYLQAYRDPRDPDERIYSISIYAEDEAGGESDSVYVPVPHDESK